MAKEFTATTTNHFRNATKIVGTEHSLGKKAFKDIPWYSKSNGRTMAPTYLNTHAWVKLGSRHPPKRGGCYALGYDYGEHLVTAICDYYLCADTICQSEKAVSG